MKGMTVADQLLAQEDVDAILTQAGLEGDYGSEGIKGKILAHKRTGTPRTRSDAEVKAITSALFRRTLLERNQRVAVIWNAAGVMSLDSGMGIKIQGIDCVTLGVLHERHLVIEYANP